VDRLVVTSYNPLFSREIRMPRPSVTSVNFWDRVERKGPDDCWPWKRRVTASGYGRLDAFGKIGVYAHRVAYLLVNPGSITLRAPASAYERGWIRHTCDNPPCCNPAHMLIGTHNDNMQDKVSRGRSKWFDSSLRSPRAKLTADDIMCIRLQKSSGTRMPALGLLYGVSRATIHGVVYGRHYKDV
jgi:hypothetical protein